MYEVICSVNVLKYFKAVLYCTKKHTNCTHVYCTHYTLYSVIRYTRQLYINFWWIKGALSFSLSMFKVEIQI